VPLKSFVLWNPDSLGRGHAVALPQYDAVVAIATTVLVITIAL
jgi:uncharacterized membrane protein